MPDQLAPLRRKILDLASAAGEGHIPSSFSVLEILWTLYSSILQPADRFILSKGHAALALYVVLAEFGEISSEMLENYGKVPLLGHPERNLDLGIVATTGSLGHGCCYSVGMALAKRIKNEGGRIYCLLGDQECSEGSVYESMLIAASLNLTNLTWIIDDNNSAQGSVKANWPAMFTAANWSVRTVNGHSIPQLKRIIVPENAPVCVVASTIKGYGLEAMRHDPRKWHHALPDAEQLAAFRAELSESVPA